MRFKIDENLPADIAADLRAAGHDADTVDDEGLAGSTDSVVMAHVQSESRVMITLDKGIADIRVYPPAQYHGIVLIRPASTGRLALMAIVRQYLPMLLQFDLAGRLFIVTEKGLRIR